MLSFLASFTASQLQAFSYGFLFFVLAIAAFFILTTDYRDPIARRFAYIATMGALLNIFAFLYHTVDALDLARQFRIVSQSLNILFIGAMLWYSVTLSEKYRGPSRRDQLIALASFAFIAWFAPFFVLDLFGSGHVIGPLLNDPSVALTPEPGPLLAYYIASFFLAWMFSVYLMSMLWLRAPSAEGRFMGALMLFCMNLPILTRLFGYAPWYGVESSDYVTLGITLLTGPIFAFGVTYAILRHKIFNLRLIAAEFFVFGMWCFVFFRALLADSWHAAMPDIILLMATIVLGAFLIRSVLGEVKQRERLQALTSELRDLNDTLELRVKERTGELNRSKEHIELVIENLTAGLVEYGGDYRVVRINRAAEAMLGVSRERVLGRVIRNETGEEMTSLAAVLFPAGREGYVKPREQPEGARLEEVSITAPMKRDLQLTTASVPMLEAGTSGFITLIRDVSREKQIDRSKSEFLTVAAHQLRTPLTAIRWALKLMLDGGTGRVTKAQREVLVDGNRAGENMLKIINDLLNAVRIEEGRFGFTFAPGDLAGLVREVAAGLHVVAQGKDVGLAVSVPDGFPPIIMDAVRLRMVVQNLIDNAIKYTLPGGTISVRLEVVGKRARLTVADTGVGISKEDQQRLFTKFFRAKRAMELFTDGSGLGLFIVKNIIVEHGGTISLASEVGIGTTVTVDLPLSGKTSKRNG